ncbi:MAG: O-antigen ligase family protein [Candidatus Hydrogenedentota bacterium]|nr:MAG: O-antigen ligase family protein [Candidatus Hydrogenedentota bacterium]
MGFSFSPSDRRPSGFSRRFRVPLPVLAEILLVLYTSLFGIRVAPVLAAFFGAAGLLIAGIVSVAWTLSLILLAIILAATLAITLTSGSAPGPAMHSAGVLAAFFAWAVVGHAAACSEAKERAAERREGERGSEEWWERIPGFFAFIAAFLLALPALLQRLLRNEPPHFWFVSSIDFAIAVLLLSASAYCSFRGRFRRFRPFLVFPVVAIATASASRAVLLSAAAFLLIIFAKVFRKRARATALLVTILLLSGAAFFTIQRIRSDPLAWNRARIYVAALNGLRERPWFGWGYGAFDSVGRRFLLQDPTPIHRVRYPVYVHSEPLELLFETGILGFSAWFALGLSWLLAIARKNRGELVVPAVLFFPALFYFPFRLVLPLFFLGFFLGRALPVSAPPRKPGLVRKTLCFAASILMAIYGLGLASRNPRFAPFAAPLWLESSAEETVLIRIKNLEPFRPEFSYDEGIYAARHGSIGGAIRGMERAADLAPAEAQWHFETARAWAWYAARYKDRMRKWYGWKRAWEEVSFIRVLEPLHLGALAALGDTIELRWRAVELERLARRKEPIGNIRAMRPRPLDLPAPLPELLRSFSEEDPESRDSNLSRNGDAAEDEMEK